MTDTQARTMEYVPLDSIAGNPRNPKRHSLRDIRDSMSRFGYTEPCILDERTQMLLSGHGRVETLLAERELGHTAPEGVMVDGDGTWLVPVVRGVSTKDDSEAAAYLIAANQLTIKGGWADDALAALLAEIGKTEMGLTGVGYDEKEVAAILARGGYTASDGSLLGIADVSYEDPRHVVEHGQVWTVGPHTLVVADVMTEWALWAPLLTDDALFMPYPGPYVALSLKAADRRMILVHPDNWLAGHVLDKFQAIHGPDSVRLQSPEPSKPARKAKAKLGG